MHTLRFYRQKRSGFACTLASGILVLGLALAAPVAYAGMGGAGGGAGAGGGGAGAAGGAGGSGAGAGGGGGVGGAGTVHPPNSQTEFICPRGMVWDSKDQKCLARRSGVLSHPHLAGFALSRVKTPSDERPALP